MSRPAASSIGSLRTSTFRLALVYSTLFTIGVGVLLSTIYWITTRALESEVDNVILIELSALADEYDREGARGLIAELNRLDARWRRAGAVYLLVDHGFNKRAGNLQRWPFQGLPRGEWLEFEMKTAIGGERVSYLVRSRVFTLPDGYLLAGTEISQRLKFQRTFRVATLWGIGSTALLGTLLGFLLSRRLASRVRAVSAECERIMAGDLSRRLPLAGASDEFDALATAVNRVLTRLDEQTRVLRATFDSTAHDLRGPLSRLRGRLEQLESAGTLDEAAAIHVERALQDIEAVQRTLTILLQIAQAESRVSLADNAETNLGMLAREIAELYEPLARERGLAIKCAAEDAFVSGSRQLLAQMIANLVENVLKHAAGGGHLEVRVRLQDGCARLEVTDRGPGIAAEDRERALHPFVRLNSSDASGSGLGLSLVAAIARLHDAELSLEDNHPGLRVIVQFKKEGGR